MASEIDLAKEKHAKENRLMWPDAIRAVAIYLVILAHSTSLPKNFNGLDLFAFSIYGFLGLLSVPLFVILSGTLLLNKTESYVNFFSKRVKRVLVPWVFWTVIIVVFKLISGEDHVSNYLEIARLTYRTFMTQYWFLPMLFGLYFLTPLLRILIKHSQNKDIIYSIVLWFIFVCIVPVVLGNYYLIDLYVIQFVGYYIFGYYLIAYPFEKRAKRLFLPIFILVSFFSPVYYMFFTPQDPTAPSQIFSHISRIVVIASSLLFILLQDYLQKSGEKLFPILKNLIVSLGQMSLGIYLVHTLYIHLYNYLHPFGVKDLPNIISIPIVSILVFSFSAFTIYLLRKLPLLKILVG